MSNILFSTDLSVSSVLDWELAALGPAEIDIAWWLFFDDLFSNGFSVPRLPGLPGKAETVAHYEQRLGRPLVDLEYYDVLATFRMAIVSVRAVDRQIKLGKIPATTSARTHQPNMRLLAQRLHQPEPEVGEDFRAFRVAIGL